MRKELVNIALAPSSGVLKKLRKCFGDSETRQEFQTWLEFILNQFTEAHSKERDKLTRCIEQAERAAGNDDAAADAAAEGLLRAGLGLVFIRFDVARQVFYYHDVLTEMVPARAVDIVSQVLSVPAGEGSVGGVVATVRQRLRMEHQRSTSSTETEQSLPFSFPRSVVSLWSCFSDARGRVAAEDWVLGNRSWMATPLFYGDEDSPLEATEEAAGLLFLFFPVDGLFSDNSESTSVLARALENHAGRNRLSLLLAMEHEALETLLSPLHVSSHSPSPAKDDKAKDDKAEDAAAQAPSPVFRGALTRRLLGSQTAMSGAGPLGFLAAFEVDGSGTKFATIGAPFTSQLFRHMRLAAFAPSSIGLGLADSMYVLSNSRQAVVDGKLVLRWETQTGKEVSPEQLESFGSGEQPSGSQPPGSDEMNQELSRLGLSVNRHDSSYVKRRLKQLLELYRAEGHIIDLLVPLALPESSHWHGCIRLNCVIDGESHSAATRLRSLIAASTHWMDLSHTTARILQGVETALQVEKDVEKIKLLLDLRVAVGLAVIEELVRLFRSLVNKELGAGVAGAGRLPRWDMALRAVRGLPSAHEVRDNLEKLPRVFKKIQSEMQGVDLMSLKLPMISLWGMARRPVLKSFPSDEAGAQFLEELLLQDAGAYHLISLVSAVTMRHADKKIRTSPDGLYQFHEKPYSLVIPPVPAPSRTPNRLKFMLSSFRGGALQVPLPGLKILDGRGPSQIEGVLAHASVPSPRALPTGQVSQTMLYPHPLAQTRPA